MFISNSFALNKEVNLVISYKDINYTGKTTRAISVNQSIPGPPLHFKQGDRVTINVYNALDEETAIHWHGLLVPWQMDGVLGVSQHGIKPHQVFKYHFKLLQSGTYWYHAHAGLQEQQGLYGAFIIDPVKEPSNFKERIIVLSDWSNTPPQKILANLKKDGDYYSPKFPLQASLAKFISDYGKGDHAERSQLLHDYQMMQQMRMNIYDINDVAYDAFLLNGTTSGKPWVSKVKVGDVVRLRFIGASAETIFRVKIPGETLKIMQVQGNEIKSETVNDFTIAPGETYDILIDIKKAKPYIIYAESLDKVGSVYGILLPSGVQKVPVKIKPFKEPPPVTREMMKNMHAEMKNSMMNNHHGMKNHTTHENMEMPLEPSLNKDQILPFDHLQAMKLTQGTKYQTLTAKVKTNHPNKPIAGVINMELFGYMNHFIWMINGKTEQEAKPIILNPGKRYRIIFTNNSMMRHPMHLHGHWFILRNGHGEYDPLLHTIEIAPGSTVVVDVDTDASGQWLFHCHMLYHMINMGRIVKYSSLIQIEKKELRLEDQVKIAEFHNRPIVRVDTENDLAALLSHRHAHSHINNFWLASFVDVGIDPYHNTQRLTFRGLYGPDYHKLQLLMNDAEMDEGQVENADLDIFYWHLISQFWALKGGVNYLYRPASTAYLQPGMGIEGLMPYYINTNIRGYYHSGSAKLDLELSRDTQIFNNFYIKLGVRSISASKTVSEAGLGAGLNQMRYALRPYYSIIPGLSVFAEYEFQKNYGAFKKLEIKAGESAIQNTVTLGVMTVF